MSLLAALGLPPSPITVSTRVPGPGGVASLVTSATGTVGESIRKRTDPRTDLVAKALAAIKARGDESNGPVPRVMPSDCKPTQGHVPGPASHMLCSKHGHVVDTASSMIIARSIAEYAVRFKAIDSPQIHYRSDVRGSTKSVAPPSVSPDAAASPEAVLSKQAGTRVRIEDIRAAVTIPAGQVLDDSTENIVSTTTEANIVVTVAEGGSSPLFPPSCASALATGSRRTFS